MTEMKERLIIALDAGSLQDALRVASRIGDSVGMLKVGSELFTGCGPEAVKELVDSGAKVFLDLKFHDIPNTVERACARAARLGVSLLDVHALGGAEMMRAARRGAGSEAGGASRPHVVAVTVLTHLDPGMVSSELGIRWTVEEAVERLALAARESGLDGVVCSGREAAAVRRACGPGFLIVCPGVRPSWCGEDDEQRRRMTPAEALRAGADYLVVGRPVTRDPRPEEAVARLLEEMEDAQDA